MKLIVKTLSDTAQAPSYGSGTAAGLDVRSDEDCIIEAGGRKCVSTGICVEWIKNNENDENPEDFYMRIGPRSGLAMKKGINVLAGICDFDFRGEYKIILHNSGNEEFIVNKNDRIAQLLLTRITRFSEIVLQTELSKTERGEGGFGSTGVK
jgi:dUTP pyrophosphatase